jgi:hypothetical protein
MSHPQTPDARARISHGLKRYHDRQRKVAEVSPRDLRRLEKSGTVAEALRPLLPIAAEEAYELTEALGGPEAVSPQRRMIIEDLAAMGITLRATLALFLQSSDSELVSKISALASARRASLQALGLERISKELDLTTYLAQKAAENRADGADGANGDNPDAQPASTDEDTAGVATRPEVVDA